MRDEAKPESEYIVWARERFPEQFEPKAADVRHVSLSALLLGAMDRKSPKVFRVKR